MPPQLEYESTKVVRRENATVTTAASWIVVVVVVVANGVLLSMAHADRSWGALQIAIMIGPLTNAAIAAVGLVAIPAVRRVAGGAPVGRYGLLAGLLPVAAIVFDAVAVFSMGLHGC